MPDYRQRAVDQEMVNGQTMRFVADEQQEIAEEADRLARENPGLGEIAALAAVERAKAERLRTLADEEQRLATAIALKELTSEQVHQILQSHRRELIEMALDEGGLAKAYFTRQFQDPAIQSLGERLSWNTDLLRHVVRTEADVDKDVKSAGTE